MFVVIVPVATALAIAAGFVIAYIAIGIAMTIGIIVVFLGEAVGSAIGLVAASFKMPKADPIWATTVAVVYFFYYVIHACIYNVPWNYVSFIMIGTLLVTATIKTTLVTLAAALIIQLIVLTEIFHRDAPFYYTLTAISGALLDWLGYMKWPYFVVPVIICLTIYFAITRTEYTPTDETDRPREAY